MIIGLGLLVGCAGRSETNTGLVAAELELIPFNDVVGDYYFGDGTGVNCNLTLGGRGEFTFAWHGCLGTYDTNNGSAGIRNGVLHLTPKKPNRRDGFRGTPTDFFPVRWGDRMYLVPTNEMVAFCSEVNQGGEPRSGNWGGYYLRQKDWDLAVTGRPAVAEPWTKFFLSQPVKGEIAQLINEQEAWLNRGMNDGLLEGMILTARAHGEVTFSQVRVEAVEKERCRIKCEWKDSRLAAGQTVSSRFSESMSPAARPAP